MTKSQEHSDNASPLRKLKPQSSSMLASLHVRTVMVGINCWAVKLAHDASLDKTSFAIEVQ